MADVRYIKFGDSGAPKIKFDSSYTDEDIRNYLKSEQFENEMASKGWLYKYGLDPVNLLDEENLDDNALQAGAKSAVDTLKQFWGAGMAAMYDTFGNEDKQMEAVEAVRQYQLDQAAHLWRKDKEGQVKPRINSLEQVFESEEEFSAFLEWVGAKMGEGAVTTLPIVLAGLVTGGVGAAAIGTGMVARKAGTTALQQAFRYGLLGDMAGGFTAQTLARMTSAGGLGFLSSAYGMAIGDIYSGQLDETDDPNAGIALALGIPYAAAEGAFGMGSVLMSNLIGKVGKRKATETVAEWLKSNKKFNIKKQLKAATRADRLKALGKGIGGTMAGEATAEALQETLTQTGQELEGGRSLSELYASPGFWKQLGEAAAAGAVGGGPFGVVGGTAQALRVGPTVDVHLDAGAQRITVPNVNTDIRNNKELWKDVDYRIGDLVTMTGAPTEGVVGPQQQPDGTSYDQSDPNNSAYPVYTVIGNTNINGEEFFLLEGTSGKGDLFVPANRKQSILRLQNETINENKYNNAAGFNYTQEESNDVNLNDKDSIDSYNLNRKNLYKRGFLKKDDNKSVEEALATDKETWVKEEVADITTQRNLYRDKIKAHDSFEKNYQPREERYREFFDDQNVEEGEVLTLQKSFDEFGGDVDGRYQKYNTVDDKDLNEAVLKQGWEQERYSKVQGLAELDENYVSPTEHKQLKELGFRGPYGQQYIDDLINDTKVEKNTNGKMKQVTRGRERLNDILENKITFAVETKGKRERSEKIVTGQNVVNPLTPAERMSELGEGIYDQTPSERIRTLKELLHLLDYRGWKWITAQEKKLKNQLQLEKRANIFASNFTKANAIQKQIDRINQKSHIIMHEGKIVGTYSPTARRTMSQEIERLQNQQQTPQVVEMITMYQTQVENIDKARVRFNETLKTFNEEPILSTEWGKLTTSHPALKRIQDKNRNYPITKPIEVTRRWELYALGAGEPRLRDDFAENAPKVLQTLKDIISNLSLDIRVDLHPFLEKDGVAMAGEYILGERGVHVAYNAVPELRPNLNRTDSINYVLHHEVMHLLRTEGFFTQKEWLALSKAAEDTWIKQYKIKERYSDLDYNLQIEEAISEAFAAYMTGRYQTGSFVGKVFERLKQYLIALANALTRNRFNTSAAIFNAIDLGMVGARYDSMQRTSDIYLRGDNINDIIVKQPWSGEQVNGFAPATRALFTKQPKITNTKNFYKWWNSNGQPSVVVDDKGAPLIVMHATRDTRSLEQAVPFNIFDVNKTLDYGFHFTGDQTTIDTFLANKDMTRSEAYIFRGFVNIKNPLRVSDFGTWEPTNVLAYLLRKNIITQIEFDREMKVITEFETTNEPQVEQLRQMGLYHGLTESFESIKKLLKSKGYDGLVYKNEGEYKHRVLLKKAIEYLANSVRGIQDPSVLPPTQEELSLLENEPMADSYVIFEPNQFKSILNAGAYDINNPDMMAANQYQPVPGEMPVDQYKPMNRQQRRSLAARQKKAMNENVKLYGKDNSTMTMPKLALWSRIIGFVREWAIDNPIFERLWTVVENMGVKAKRIQATFHRMMLNYNALIKDPIMREAMYRAQIISQFYPNQKFRRDQDGRIIFRAPNDIKPEDSPEGIEIQPGEVIILDGDAALAYEQFQASMLFMGREQIKGAIAGGYLDQLKEAINIINFHKGTALSEVYAPTLVDKNGNEINTSNKNIDEQLEELTYAQMQSIMQSLRHLLDGSDAEFYNRTALTKEALQNIRKIIGIDETGLPLRNSKGIIGTGLLSLQDQMRQFEEFRLGGDYVPLMRFGNYSITIINTSEEQYLEAKETTDGAFKYKGKWVTLNPNYIVRRQHYESEKEAEEARGKFMTQYSGNADIEVRPVLELTAENIKEQISAGALDMIEVARFLSEPKKEIFESLENELRALVENNKNIIGFDKFFTPRQRVGGVPGYSADFGRAASQFAFLGSRYASRSRYMNEATARKKTLDDAIKEDPKKYQQLKIGVDKWWEYSNDPYLEFAGIRRVGFWWYLGGNLSSAFLQIMSAVQFTGPILSQMAGTAKSGAELSKAFKDASAMISWTNNEYGDVFIDWTKVPDDVKDAITNDMPHYLKQGMALMETGQVPGREGFDQESALRNFEQMIIGGPFNTMEAISRMTAYIAAYRLAQDPKVREKFYDLYSANQIVQGAINDNDGVLTPEIIARTMIDETFGVYGKINRPQIMRGYMAIPALFQTYIGQMFALTYRMLTGGKTAAQKAAGRKVFAKMMLMIALTGGLFGLPGSDDAEELANWMIEKAPIVGTGLKTDIRAAMREMLYDYGFSAGMINAMENGIIEAGLDIDVQRRLSLGNVPGSQQVRALAGLLGLSQGGNAADFAGAPGSVFMTAIREGSQAIREGESLVDVAFKSSPLFIRNMYKAYDQTLGKGFTETNFGTVLADDSTAMETFFQAIGFGSARLKRNREAIWQERLNATRNASKQKKINAQITNAYRDIFVGANVGNSGLAAEGQLELNKIYRELMKWNSKQDIQNQIFPDLTRLMQQALEATYADIRLIGKDKLNIEKNLKQRKALGID